MSANARIGAAGAFALLLAFTTWWELAGRFPSSFPGSDGFVVLLILATTILAGVVIGRWWAVSVLIGPVLVMLVLEVTGYDTGAYLEWGERPLCSPEGVRRLFWQASRSQSAPAWRRSPRPSSRGAGGAG